MTDCGCSTGCQPGYIAGGNKLHQVNGCEIDPCPVFKTYVLPANLGTDAEDQPYAPKLGAWRDAIVVYSANNAIYIYDHQGVFTKIGIGDVSKVVNSINGLTGEVTLGALSIQMNGTELARYNGGEPVVLNLPIPELGEVAAGNVGYVNGDMVNAIQVALSNSIATETGAREAAITELNSQISGLNTEISQTNTNLTILEGKVQNNTDSIEALQTQAGDTSDLLSQTVERDTTVAASADNVTLTKITGTILNNDSTETAIDFPMASDSQAGCITAGQFQRLEGDYATKAEVNTVITETVTGLTSLLERPQFIGGILAYSNIPANTSGKLDVAYADDMKALFNGAPFVYATPLLTGYTGNTTFPDYPQITVTDMTENGFSLRFKSGSASIPTLRVHWFAIGDAAKTELGPIPAIS